MAKAKFDYAKEDVVRRGDELWQSTHGMCEGHHLVMVRRFDPKRLELGGWVQANVTTTDEAAAASQFAYIADHMRSEGALSVAWVQVNSYNETAPEHRTIGKYSCHGTIRDVRSSAMLQADGGVPRGAALDRVGLGLAVNRDFSDWLDSQDQSRDNAAKDAAFPAPDGTGALLPTDTITVGEDGSLSLDGPGTLPAEALPVEHVAQEMETIETVNEGGYKHSRQRRKAKA